MEIRCDKKNVKSTRHRSQIVSLEYHTGIRCLELNLKELESAVKTCFDGAKSGSYSSWKYPHMKIGCVNVEECVKSLRGRNITPIVRYIHLAELCIDRLYYSHLFFLSQLRDLCCKVCLKRSQGQLQDDTHLEELVPGLKNPNALDCSSRAISLGKLIHWMIKYFSRLSEVSLFNCPRNERECIKGILSKSNSTSSNSENHTQTEDIMIKCCNSCFAVQNILKTVGETLEHCLHALSTEPVCISRTKVQIREEMFWCSQWTAIKRWCRALEIDCQKIVERVTENVHRHEVLEKEVGKVQSLLNVKNRDHGMITEQIKKKYKELRLSIDAEKKENIKLQKRQAALQDEHKKLKRLMIEKENIQKEESHRTSILKGQILDMEKLHHETNLNFRTMEEDLETELRETEHLQGLYQTNQADWAVQKEAICQQTNSLENEVQEILTKNTNLKYTLTRQKKRLRMLQTEDQDNDSEEGLPELISKLENELKEAESRLERLVLYSENDSTDVVHNVIAKDDILAEMEQQQLANEIRIKILEKQNEKFHGILGKLKSCMSFRTK